MYGLIALMVGAQAHHKEALVVAGPVPQHSQGLVSKLAHLTGVK